MKRQPTPDILGAILGAPPNPPPMYAVVASTATPPAPAQSSSVLSPTLARLAARLAARADDAGVLWLPEAQCAEVFGTASHGTQRNQLSSLKTAGVISYFLDDGWLVRLVHPRTNRASVHR